MVQLLNAEKGQIKCPASTNLNAVNPWEPGSPPVSQTKWLVWLGGCHGSQGFPILPMGKPFGRLGLSGVCVFSGKTTNQKWWIKKTDPPNCQRLKVGNGISLHISFNRSWCPHTGRLIRFWGHSEKNHGNH